MKAKTNCEKSSEDDSNFNLISNAPTVSSDYDVTVSAIFSALSNRQNLNIGIIGGFGSGKSSAITSFSDKNDKLDKNNNAKRKILKISLSDYTKGEEMNEKFLQLAIIKQFLYSIKPCKIPFSSFNRKGLKPAHYSSLIATFLLIIFVILGITSIYSPCLQSYKLYSWIPIIFILIWLIISIAFLIPNLTIRTKIKDLEIEFQTNNIDNKRNLFDMFIDDLIYYFKKSKVDLVVFEDIDRYENCCESLFTKLSSLNTLINNVPEIKKKRKVVFLYAVKEDIFDGEKKSKFFDILIPIKPILSTNNSYERLCYILGEIKEKFPDDYLRSVALNFKYVRQINNVVNGFNILTKNEKSFSETLNSYLFTALLFKHLFPFDYILHIRGEGIITFLMDKHSSSEELLIRKLSWDTNKYLFSQYNDNKNANLIFDNIKNFYIDLRKYLNPTSFDMISNFPETNITQEDRYFVRNVLSNNDIEEFDYPIDSLENVLGKLDNAKYASRPGFYNLTVLKEISINLKYQKLYKEFINNFKMVSDRNNKFVNLVIRMAMDGDSCYINFLKDISNIHPILNNFSFQSDITLNEVLLFLVQNKILNKDNFAVLNTNRIIENTLNESSDPIATLSQIDSSLYPLFSDANSSLKLKSLFNANAENEKNYAAIDFVLDNVLFIDSQENIDFIIEYKKKRNPNEGVFGILNHMCPKLYKFFKDCTFFLENSKIDYKNENPDNVAKILTEFKFTDDSIKIILESCPQITFNESFVVNKNIILAFFAKKLLIDINQLTYLLSFDLTNYPKKVFLSFICKNPDIIISNKTLTSTGKNHAYEILNSPECKYDVSGKILEKCFDHLTLDCTLIKQDSDSFLCAIDYPYFSYNASFHNIIFNDDDLFRRFVMGYYPYLIDLNSSVSLPIGKLLSCFGLLSDEKMNPLLIKHCSTIRNNCSDPLPFINFYLNNIDFMNVEVVDAIVPIVKKFNQKVFDFLCVASERGFVTNEDIINVFINNMAVDTKISMANTTSNLYISKILRSVKSFGGRNGQNTISIKRLK